MRFRDRTDAGRRLAEKLERFRGEEAVVYALPRGGVVLGAIVARELDAPLDLVIARKIGHPHAPEYAIGAITDNEYLVGNEAEVAAIDESWLRAEIEAERREARRRRQVYLGGRAPLPVAGKIALIIDDGIATGLTLRAAIREVRHRNPRRVVVGVPVIPWDAAITILGEVDEVVALEIPLLYLGAVGLYYDDFSPVEDHEVIRALATVPAPLERVRSSA